MRCSVTIALQKLMRECNAMELVDQIVQNADSNTKSEVIGLEARMIRRREIVREMAILLSSQDAFANVFISLAYGVFADRPKGKNHGFRSSL